MWLMCWFCEQNLKKNPKIKLGRLKGTPLLKSQDESKLTSTDVGNMWYLHRNMWIHAILSFPLCSLRISWSLWASLRNINHIVPPVLVLMLEMVYKKHVCEVTWENANYSKMGKDKGKIKKKTLSDWTFLVNTYQNLPNLAEICTLQRPFLENSKECLFLKNVNALRWPKKGSRHFRMYPRIG